jgi:hypothetical protein
MKVKFTALQQGQFLAEVAEDLKYFEGEGFLMGNRDGELKIFGGGREFHGALKDGYKLLEEFGDVEGSIYFMQGNSAEEFVEQELLKDKELEFPGAGKTKLALLNTSIATSEGVYRLRTITTAQAVELVQKNKDNLDSAVGHESTAQVMSTLLGEEIPVNRQMFSQETGQLALVFKLNSRPPEGKILSQGEIEEIGYRFQILEKFED